MMYVEASALRDAERSLAGIPQGIERATSRAINRAVRQSQTLANRLVRQDYTLDRALVNAHFNRSFARVTDTAGGFEVEGHVINIEKYNTNVLRSGAVSTKVLRKGKKKRLYGPFRATMSNGFTGIFHRVGRRRLPIESVFGPSVAQSLSKDENREQVEDMMIEVFGRRMDHEVNNILRGITY